jgi:hypothetical protein
MTEDGGVNPTDADAAAATTAPTPTARVRPTVRANPAGSRFRWVVASVVTAAVLVVSTLGFMILSAGAATSALVGYVPANSVGYVELRLDAPGDQRQNAANLLSHFPGFADQSTLGTKLDEALDQLVGNLSGGRQTFTGNIKAWLGDSIAVVMTRIPPMTAAARAQHAKSGLVLVSVKDPAAARTWAETTLGPATGAETYGGIALSTIETKGSPIAYGVVSNVLLAGDPQSVHDAIDSRGAGTFGDSTAFKAAAASVSGDRLAFGYLDLRQVGAAVEQRGTGSPSPAAALDALPDWVAVSVRAESDSVAATLALPDSSLAPVAANHTSVLATRLPGTTVVAGELHDLATLIAAITTTLRATPATSGGQDQLDQAIQALGGIDSLVGWMGDATVAAIPSAGALPVAPGLVVQAKDAKEAEARLTQLKNLVSLSGASLGVAMTDEVYHGTTITLVDLGALAGAVPGLPAWLPSRIAIAQQNDLVVAGLGDEFVKAVLDTKPGATLADRDTYRATLDKAGASNTGQLFVDLQAVFDLATKGLPAAELQHYEADIRPYLAPFRAFAASGSAGDPNRGRIVVTVK